MKEIEIKALLTKEKYGELKRVLPEKYKKIYDDSLTTVRFRPKDVRVRYSDNLFEVVFKDGNPTTISRKEVCVNLDSVNDCHKMIDLLKQLGFSADPSWIKHKQEFVCELGGHEYVLSLQHIENFAYLLEVEIIDDDEEKHIPNLKKIISDLGCEQIEPDDFKAMIKEYISKFGQPKKL